MFSLQSHKGSAETDGVGVYPGLRFKCFNPTRVLLKQSSPPPVAGAGGKLQSHKGSAETIPDAWIADYGESLQSHKGSAETRVSRRIGRRVCVSFNPTRVLLKPSKSTAANRPSLALQSHKGSAETRGRGRGGYGRRGFNPTRVLLKHGSLIDTQTITSLQSHKGSAETARGRVLVEVADHGFNPTRVLLKPDMGAPPAEVVTRFNPTRVLLKRGVRRADGRLQGRASIPQGFC